MPDFNDDDHPLDALLEDARMAAESEWEEDFVADMAASRKRYGRQWNPTDRQVDKLRQIAGEEWLEDSYDR